MTFAEAKGKPITEGEEKMRFLVCSVCGKELEKYIPFPWSEGDKPAWVTR